MGLEVVIVALVVGIIVVSAIFTGAIVWAYRSGYEHGDAVSDKEHAEAALAIAQSEREKFMEARDRIRERRRGLATQRGDAALAGVLLPEPSAAPIVAPQPPST